jgi:hypothetical protein
VYFWGLNLMLNPNYRFDTECGVPVAGGGARSNLPVGKDWPFLPVYHSSKFLRNSLRNSSSVTLRNTSRFICVVRNLFRKRRHTFRTVQWGLMITKLFHPSTLEKPLQFIQLQNCYSSSLVKPQPFIHPTETCHPSSINPSIHPAWGKPCHSSSLGAKPWHSSTFNKTMSFI